MDPKVAGVSLPTPDQVYQGPLLGGDDHNHLVPPEAHLQAALTHQ